jgi:hypothetical protein
VTSDVDEEVIAARPSIGSAIKELETAARRIGDVFTGRAVRNASFLLRQQDVRLSQAEAWASECQAQRDGLERQRDELRRAERALRSQREGLPDAAPVFVPAQLVDPEPLLLRIRQRDAALAERDIALADRDRARRDHLDAVRELEVVRAVVVDLRERLAGIDEREDHLDDDDMGDLEEAASAPAALPSTEAILNARREQLVAEASEINSKFAAAATTRPPDYREYRKWHAEAVRRTQHIQIELRDINARLKIERMARAQVIFDDSQRRKGKL